MRLIAGRFRGTKLAAVGAGDASAHLRPTPDRVRESLFSMLQARGVLVGAQVLDLFAGTGALGLEALSRGAKHVTFVDNGRVAQSLIRDNIAKTRCGDETALIKAPFDRLPVADTPASLVFLDPPYGKGFGTKAIDCAITQGWIATGTFVVAEDQTATPHPKLSQAEHKTFGGTILTLGVVD